MGKTMSEAFLDPEISFFNKELSAEWQKHPSILDVSAPEARKIAEKVRARWSEGGPEMAATLEHTIALPSGSLRIRIYYPDPPGPDYPAMVYIHGGGFVMFSIDTHDRLMREYASLGRFAVIGVDYPLAPENKFPVALDLITEFTDWLSVHAGELFIDASRIVLGGDSAGGNLSVSACLRLRDKGKLHLVRAVLSNYGGFAASVSDEAEAKLGGPGAVLNASEVEFFWSHYLPSPDYATDPYACPLHADLRELPPMLIVIPDRDIVSEHSFQFAEKLAAAGVSHEVKVYRGATHSFLEAMSVSALARQAIEDGAVFVARHLLK